MTRKQLSQFSVDELRMLRHRYLDDKSTTDKEYHRNYRILKRINAILEVKQLIAEFHKNRLIPSTEKIFRNAKRNGSS